MFKIILAALLAIAVLFNLAKSEVEPYVVSASEIDIITLVVRAEAGSKATEYERELILECILYKKYRWDPLNIKSYTEYFATKNKHFDGYNIIDRYVDDEMLPSIRNQVLKQLRSKSHRYRAVRYFHIIESSTNKDHIIDVLMRTIKGELRYLNTSKNGLIHDFFEDVNPPKGYFIYREKFIK